MTLLSPLALLFGLFAAVPLILHLYQRRRKSVMWFSTNRFFTKSIIRSQRNLRLRHLLLLLLRVAACALLALALSRPILTWVGLAGGQGRRDLVILLDDSLSMGAGDSRFDRAKQIAIDTLYQLKAGDRAAVVTFTGRALGRETRSGAAFSPSPLRLMDQLRKLEPSSAAGDAHHAMVRAAKLFAHSEQRTRSMLIITDKQESDWRQGDWPQPPMPVGGLLVALDEPTRDNLTLDQAVLSQSAAVVGQPNLLRVKITNLRPSKQQADLVLLVDDVERTRRPIELLGRSPLVEQVPIVFDKPGEHRLVVRVDVADALPRDNDYFMAVNVSPRLPILLVDGGAAGGGRRTAGFFLRMAMLAVSADGDEVQADHVTPVDLPRVELEHYSVVLLSNVRELPLPQVERLETFVKSGGGLGIFLGDRIDTSFYNETLGAPSRPLGGLLPATINSVTQAGEAAGALHIVEAELDHPILQRFAGSLRSALGGVDVYRCFDVTPQRAWTLATMNRSLPLMVERAYGRGRVILFTTAPQPDWTNLPVRRVFIPLINRTVSYLAGSGPMDVGQEVGYELTLLRGGWDYQREVSVRRPDGELVQASVKLLGAEPIAYLPGEVVTEAGFYDMQTAGTEAHRAVRAVNVPRSESHPRVIEWASLPERTGRWQIDEAKADDALPGKLTQLLSEDRGGREVWDALLWIVLAIVLLEPLVAGWTGRKRDETAAPLSAEAIA
jgi:hypothetical protein